MKSSQCLLKVYKNIKSLHLLKKWQLIITTLIFLIWISSLVYQYNNTYHYSINRKPINDIKNFDWKIETNNNASEFRVNDRVIILELIIEWELLSLRIFSVKVTLKIGQRKYLLLILFWKLIFGLIKLKVETENKW